MATTEPTLTLRLAVEDLLRHHDPEAVVRAVMADMLPVHGLALLARIVAR